MLTAATLTAVCAAIMASADIPDDQKEEACKGVAEKFADAVDVSDEDTVDAMPPEMQAAYNAADTPEEDKKKNLSAFRHSLQVAAARQIVVQLKAGKGKAPEGNQTPAKTELTAKDIASAVSSAVAVEMDKLRTSGFKTLGAAPGKTAVPEPPKTGKDADNKTDTFFSRRVEPLIKAGSKPAEALQAARRSYPKEFAEERAAKAGAR